MKYLLKTKSKEDATLSPSIGCRSGYHEFDSILDLTRFVFENSAYIKDYSIREIREISEKDSINVGQPNGPYVISGEHTFARID